jgi:hypothetical protein
MCKVTKACAMDATFLRSDFFKRANLPENSEEVAEFLKIGEKLWDLIRFSKNPTDMLL